jgi:hypothetical protein
MIFTSHKVEGDQCDNPAISLIKKDEGSYYEQGIENRNPNVSLKGLSGSQC